MSNKSIKNSAITENLSDKQIKELKKLANEPSQKNTLTLVGFKKLTDKWRKKEPTKTTKMAIEDVRKGKTYKAASVKQLISTLNK